MTVLSRSRVTLATGLTLGTAVASLAFAPAAFAAEPGEPVVLPGLELSSSTVVAGGSINDVRAQLSRDYDALVGVNG